MHDTPKTTPPDIFRRSPSAARLVLNIGSGAHASTRLQKMFPSSDWNELRLDIEPGVRPDVVGSLDNVGALFEPDSIDAVWASHVLEHLFRHEVRTALLQLRSILKPNGFAVITSPDIEVAAGLAARYGMDHVVYHSPAGPITAHDMFYGHSSSIAAGQIHMAHKTAFTRDSLGQGLIDAGFPVVLAKSDRFDLWAVALMERADRMAIERQLAQAGLDMTS